LIGKILQKNIIKKCIGDMKISFNVKFVKGPYGGGMQFANFLRDYLVNNNIKVIDHLNHDDIDIILHISPFLTESSSYSFWDAFLYKIKNPEAVIIHRINECDERKGTKHVNKMLALANKYSDYTVYIASWLQPLLERAGIDPNKPWTVIHNGADQTIFNRQNKTFDFFQNRKLKMVTHHWGASYLKGHDIYKKIDELLERDVFKDKFEFTFIGNYPKDIIYKNITILEPLSGKELANELKKHDIYITASRNEPAGMHHIEGIMCGLPILYINSGALPEYCSEYGIEFNEHNLEEKLFEMYENYHQYLKKIENYKFTSNRMGERYLGLFRDIYLKREKFIYNKKHLNKLMDYININFNSLLLSVRRFRIKK